MVVGRAGAKAQWQERHGSFEKLEEKTGVAESNGMLRNGYEQDRGS